MTQRPAGGPLGPKLFGAERAGAHNRAVMDSFRHGLLPLWLFAALVLSLTGALAQDRAPPLPPRDGPVDWTERLALDRKLTYHSLGARTALSVLDGEGARGPSEVVEDRAAALYALGAARVAAERPRLESVARLGPEPERRAALYALGEMGLGEPLFLQIAREEPPEMASAAFLGLVLARSRSLGTFAAELLGARPELEGHVASIGAFVRQPTERAALVQPDRVDEYLDLRWRAAREHGLIGGQSWRGLVLRDLADDETFVDEVVLPSLATVRHPGARDHLASLLVEHPSPSVFAACMDVLPTELERILSAGLFTPPDATYWERAVASIERRGPAAADSEVLTRALAVEAVARRAAALLAEIGEASGWLALGPDLASLDATYRAFAARALGASEEPTREAELERLALDPDPRVRAAALVGRLRHGERRATEEARDRLAEASVDTAALVAELLEVRRAPRVRALLEEFLPSFSGEVRLRAALSLCLPGRIGPRDVVRDALANGRAGAYGAAAVRVLSDTPSQEEIDLLHAVFPSAGDRALNAEAARALLSVQHPSGTIFLRAALWRAPWHRSVLAGHLLASQGGLHALLDELDSAPAGASSRDLRRIGFAIGSWGGPQQVEVLARRLPANDPALQGAYLGALSSRTY